MAHRASGRSLSDFRIRSETTPNGLLPAEELLLNAVHDGETCSLTPQKQRDRVDNACDRIADPGFFILCTDVLREHPRRSGALAYQIANEDDLVQPFFDELVRFAQSHPTAPVNWADFLTANPELPKQAFDDCRECFIRELRGWRGVDVTDAAVLVRGAFIRFLALGGDENAPVHEKGVQLEGAYIASCPKTPLINGAIDIECAEKIRPIALVACRLEKALTLKDASLTRLILNGSFVPGIAADSAEFSGNLHMANGFRSQGAVRLLDADIGGQLDCEDGQFLNPGAISLNCNNASIGESVYLSRGFRAEGAVRLRGASVGVDVHCNGGTFHHFKERAPNPTRRRKQDLAAEDALSLEKARVVGTLWLGASKEVPRPCDIGGSLNLKHATVSSLVDNVSFWPRTSVTTTTPPRFPLRCDIILDGFTYDGLIGSGDYDSKTRLGWLARQPEDHLEGIRFRPQPWEQLIKVYRAMGHETWAREVSKDKQRRLHAAKIEFYQSKLSELSPIASGRAFWWTLRDVIAARIKSLFDRFVIGYGYGYLRLLTIMALLFLSCAEIYHYAFLQGLFVPKSPAIYTAKNDDNDKSSAANTDSKQQSSHKCSHNWSTCKPPLIPPEYPAFNPYVYSADLIFPLLSFGQEDSWLPATREQPATKEPENRAGSNVAQESRMALGRPPLAWEVRSASHDGANTLQIPLWLLQTVTGTEVVLGWILSTLFIAVVSGLMKRD